MESKHTEAARPTSTALRVGGRGVFDSGGERNKISRLALTERQTFIKWTVENQQQHNFVGCETKQAKVTLIFLGGFIDTIIVFLISRFNCFECFCFLEMLQKNFIFLTPSWMCSFIIQRCAFQEADHYDFFISSSLDMDVNLGRHIMNIHWWNPFPRCT